MDLSDAQTAKMVGILRQWFVLVIAKARDLAEVPAKHEVQVGVHTDGATTQMHINPPPNYCLHTGIVYI